MSESHNLKEAYVLSMCQWNGSMPNAFHVRYALEVNH